MPTDKTNHTSFKKFINVCLTLAALQAGSVLAGDLHLPLTGSIAIDSQGHVTDCEIISKAGSEAVKAAVLQSMRGWRFVPVVRDGIAVPARSKVNLRLLATEVNGGYEMKIERAQFFGGREPADKGMEPPRYPKDAARIGLSGNVLLALQVDSQGRVTDVVSVQSSLLVSNTPESVMRQWRRVFEKASEDAARKWTFKPADPAQGDELVTTLIVPVTYRIGDGSGPRCKPMMRVGSRTRRGRCARSPGWQWISSSSTPMALATVRPWPWPNRRSRLPSHWWAGPCKGSSLAPAGKKPPHCGGFCCSSKR